MPNAKLGIRCKFYINGGTFAAPNWYELTSVGDFTQSVEWDTVEVNTRYSRVKKSVKTLLALSWSGKIKVSDAGPGYAQVMTALVTDEALDVMVLNGPSDHNGVIGYRCEVQVMSGTEDQGTGAVLWDEVKFVPTPTDNPVQTVFVTGGAPVFQTLLTADGAAEEEAGEPGDGGGGADDGGEGGAGGGGGGDF